MKKERILLMSVMMSVLLTISPAGAETETSAPADEEQLVLSEAERESDLSFDSSLVGIENEITLQMAAAESINIYLEFTDESRDSGDEVRIVCDTIPDSFSWEISTDGIVYNEIEDEYDEIYTIRNSDSGKFIRGAVTIEGQKSYTAAFTAGKSYPSKEERPNYQAERFSKVIKKTPAQYIFKLKSSDKKFVLLKETDSIKSRYFIASYDDYGKRLYDTATGSGSKFNPERESNIAYFLNHDLIDETSEYNDKLPSEIVSYIDMSHSWKTHTPMSGANGNLEPYKVKCGVALMSKEEFYEFCDKTMGAGENPRLGVIDNINGGTEDAGIGWMLRSARNPYGILSFIISETAGTNMADKGPTSAEMFIRPVFYLNEDFFRKAALDLRSTGEEIIKVLKDNYTRSELSQIYSQEDLIKIYGRDVIRINSCTKTDSGEGIVIDAEVENIDVFDMNITLIAVCYDADNTMVALTEERHSLLAGQTADICTLLKGNLSQAEKICLFVWDSVENQVSLSETITF